jgi:uncharacterized membrane protein HdeD (DUF308 family)
MKIRQKSDKWLGVIWLMLGMITLFFVIAGQYNVAIWCGVGGLLCVGIFELVKCYGKRNTG